MRIAIRRLTCVAVLSLGLIGTASAQSEGPGRELVPSSVIRLSADTLRSGTLSVAKVFVVPYTGRVRASWQVKSNEPDKTATVSVASLIDSCSNNSSSQTFV